MTVLHGFKLIKKQNIPEINALANLYRHEITGAELISMENDDENKVFGITFRTPPIVSDGVAHILEHAVLAGSQKYPVKEPFVELLKGSLQTFVNAFTFPDKTCYPCASQNLQDFYNLIDVYIDAVFHPLLHPNILDQEGWHYEMEDPKDEMVYKGVVFNEMKGAYSDPNRILNNEVQYSLFPGHVYSVSSGGDPKIIPDLTYEQFKGFHEKYYHPSNARIFFYGDDDPGERLRLMNECLSDYAAAPVQSAVALQTKMYAPKAVTAPYAASDENAKSYLTLNWLLAEQGDAEISLALSILEHILLGSPASPLRKALLESNLGEDLAGIGLENELRQIFFSTGLKGIDSKDADKVEALIKETLEDLSANGIDPDTVAASINTIEFNLRENNTGAYPRGIVFMLRALEFWLYDFDPFASLAFETPLRIIKEKLGHGDRYFEDLIQNYLIDNSHHTSVLLNPDPMLNQRDEREERAKLEKIQKDMSGEQIDAVIEMTQKLIEIQNTADSPDALRTLPMLTLADLDKDHKPIPIVDTKINDVPILHHDLSTNGILYLDIGFDLHALPQELLPFVALFGRALLEMGTDTEDFVRLSQRIGRDTGGIRPNVFSSMIKDLDQSATYLFYRGKSIIESAPKLLKLLEEILLTANLDNQERFRQIVLEEKAGAEASLIPTGHIVVNNRLKAKFNEADWVSEQIGGIDFLFFLRKLIESIENDWSGVLSKLELLRKLLINQSNLLINITVNEDAWLKVQPFLMELISILPQMEASKEKWDPDYNQIHEGLSIPAQVNYVGKGANLYQMGYKLSGTIAVITRYLGTTWLWEKIRVQGGAYGGFSTFDQQSGLFNYLSYRDPNLLRSLENYDGTAPFLMSLDLSDEELIKVIIGAIGGIDAYRLPDAKGYTSMTRHLLGVSDEFLQQYRNEVIATKQDDFKEFAKILAKIKDDGKVVVLGSQEAMNIANKEIGTNWLDIAKVM